MNKIFLATVFLYCLLNIHPQNNAAVKTEELPREETPLVFSKLNKFLSLTPEEEKILAELFTVNIGVMKFKQIGNIRDINPVDSQLLVNSIKIELEKVRSIRLDKKSAVLKGLNVYKKIAFPVKDATTDKSIFEKKSGQMEFFGRKLFFSNTESDDSIVYEIFLELKKNEKMGSILKQWIENIENPFYSKNTGEPFERFLKSEEKICETEKINDKGPIDFLFYGEIERVDKYYFINLYVYSNLLKKRVAEVSYTADSFNITEKTSEKLKLILSKVFLINYASLTVLTDDPDSEIFIDGEYAGRNNTVIDYLVPSQYIVTVKKKDYIDKIENISLESFDKKSIKIDINEKKELQVVSFNIEPYGTRIFLNSVYQGKTPFFKALPKGNYVIYAKNDLYEDHRYIFDIELIDKDEKIISFHLKSKNILNYFLIKKNLYYASFWNFTFSMMATVPLIVFTKYFYDTGGNNPENARLYNAFYAATAPMLAHTVISLGLLFAALANYLITLEKKDFIPILDFYKNEEGRDTIKVGGNYKF